MTDEVLDAINKSGSQQPPAAAPSAAPTGDDEVMQAIQKSGPAQPPAPQEAKPPAEVQVPTEPQAEKPVTSWSEVPGQAASHLIPSAVATGEAMAQPFIHPIQTYENLRDIGHGILQKAGIMSGQEDTGKVDAVMKYFGDRYGGMQELRNTIAHDPVGFATDAATVLTGGEAALGRVAGTAAKAAGTVGRAIEPLAAPRAIARGIVPGGARELSEAGVSLTPGQMAGGFGKAAEDMVTSIPVLGSWIKNARARSVESFNKAVANQVLEPIGESVGKGTKAGHELVNEVEDKLTDAYSKITPNLRFKADGAFVAELNNIQTNKMPLLPLAQQRELNTFLAKKLPAGWQYSAGVGLPFKGIESDLNGFVRSYRNSTSWAERDMAQVANDILMSMRTNVARLNPQLADELTKANTAWAMYDRMRRSAAKGEEGVFTPNQLLKTIYASDKSIGHGAFAKGDALMQTFAQLGQRVLPSKVPTSGTSERAAMMGAVFGGGYLYAPHTAAGVFAGTLPYTKAGQAATNLLYKGAGAARKPFTYLPRGTTYQLGKMDESQQDAYDRARRFFPP